MSPRRSCCCGDCDCPWCSSGTCWEDYAIGSFSATVEGVGISLTNTHWGTGLTLLQTVVSVQGSDPDDCGIEDLETNVCSASAELPAVLNVSDGWRVGFYWYMRGSDLMMLVCLDFFPAATPSSFCDGYMEEVTLVSGGSTVNCSTFSESGSATRCFQAGCSAGPSSASWAIAKV